MSNRSLTRDASEAGQEARLPVLESGLLHLSQTVCRDQVGRESEESATITEDEAEEHLHRETIKTKMSKWKRTEEQTVLY